MLAQIQIDEAVEHGVLTLPKHDRIIGNIDVLAKRSRMPQQAVLTSLKDNWTATQIKKLVKLRKMCGLEKGTGLYLVNDKSAIDKFDKMSHSDREDVTVIGMVAVSLTTYVLINIF